LPLLIDAKTDQARQWYESTAANRDWNVAHSKLARLESSAVSLSEPTTPARQPVAASFPESPWKKDLVEGK
jgi:hypothetical protein